MAINDIAIGQMAELDLANVTDETVVSSVEDGLNYKLSMSTIAQYVASFISTNRPLGEMSLTVPVEQTFSGSTFAKITAFDKIQYERDVDVDTANDQIIILNSGDYRTTININAVFSSNQGVEFALMINGTVAESLGTIQGRGNGKPIYLGGADIDPLTLGDVLTLGAREDEGGSVDITFNKVRITVEGV